MWFHRLLSTSGLFGVGVGVGPGVGDGGGVDGPSITRPTEAITLAAQRRQNITGQKRTSVAIEVSSISKE